jgi:mRNA-degrading endonuclease toxin of MazEF toxin-antitoxin module
VLTDQVQPLDTGRLGKRIGSLTADEMIAVDLALTRVLGL